MADVLFQDKLNIPTQRKFKDSGQMIAPCSIARTGVMSYLAKECGDAFKDRDPMSIVKIATLAEDLFCKDSIESYRSAPITVGHPEDDVNTENSKDLVKGMLEGLPLRDGELLSATLVLNDADAISITKQSDSQLSSGHTARLVLCDAAVTGYDAKKTHIRCNHVAIVPRGRAGADVRIADADAVAEEVFVEPVFDAEGNEVKPVEVPAAVVPAVVVEPVAAEVVEPVAVALGDAAALAIEVAQLTVKLEDAQAEINTLKLIDIDTLVQERLELVSNVLKLADGIVVTGKSAMELKREVVAKCRDADMTGKSDAYIEARYEVLLEDAAAGKPTPVESDMTKALRTAALVKSTTLKDKELSPAELSRQKMILRNQGA